MLFFIRKEVWKKSFPQGNQQKNLKLSIVRKVNNGLNGDFSKIFQKYTEFSTFPQKIYPFFHKFWKNGEK